MVGLMSVCKLILLILWSIGLLLFTSCVKVPEKEFDLHLYQVDKTLLECPSGWLKYRNHCYLIVTEETTFQQADILCKRYGGYLVKVNGYNDNNWFGKLITAHNISDVWLGLQRKKSGDFLWSSGQLAQVEDGFWAEQLPIKSTGYGLCTVLGISLTDFGQYRWRLVNCEIGYSSICQSTACVAGHFRCTDGSGCISNSLVCDGIYQCDDHSDEHNCPGSCGGHLQGRFHTFHSPHFPNDYPRYSSCIWKLETQIGTRIKLKFDSFALEALYDKIIIHDGSSERDPLVGLYSGTDIPNVPYSSSNFYLVIFQSDQDNQMSGFNASFSAEPVSECGSTLNASGTAQWFSSPNFPNSYPNNVLCDWLIMADNSLDLISLQFNSLTLDTSDFIEIRQGESLDSPLYGRYTGDILPPVFVVTSHSVLIRLYTDYTRTGTGFNVTYHTGCNNTVFNGYARVMSPGYSITKYPNNLNCNWTIIDPSQRDLLVLFDDNFDTERGFDIMNITVLPTDNHTFYQHSGHTIPPPIEISTGQFHINFYTDSQVNRNGWSFTVSFDCPTLPLSDHQKKNSSSTKFGTYVHFSCDSGYQLTGTSLLICDIGGRWSASPPTCDVINCGSPTIPIHLELVSVSSTYYLGQAKYRCNPGYKSLDSSTGICQSNGHWTLPVCYENNCPKLVVTDKLQFTTSSESQFSYGDIVSYGCDDNYRLVGASMVYCTRNGTWSKSTPKCIPPLCPPIYIHNGYTNITDSVIGGSFVHVTCNHGYKLFGKQVVSCGLNGIYTTLPTCQDINECSDNTVCGIHTCQNTPGSYRCACNHGYQNPPGNYTVCKDSDECSAFPCSDICENYEGGYRCKCDAGHQLYTDSTVRVVKRKVLRPNSTCIAICPKFTVGNNGIAVADTLPLNSGDYIAPTIITIHCPLGTLPDGSATVECQLDGTWNDTVTTCQDQVCTPLPHPAHGEVVYLNGTRAYNSVVVYTCDNMYRLIGVELRFCQPVNNTGRLEWSGSTPICQEIMCPAIPDPANGKTVYISTRIGAVAEYSCDCGYQLIGSKTRTCQPDGLWDGRNAICVSTSVCQPPASLNVYRMTPTLTFYTIGTGVSLQCQKPGYKPADVTPMKCVIQQPQTATTKPSYILHYKMMFSLPVVYNKTCVELFVNETKEIFTQIAQNKCSILNGPAINITPKPSHSHQMLTIDLSIQISMYKTGVFSSVCNCSNQLKSFTDNGNIQTIVSSLTLNGTHDKICPSYFISNSGNLLFNSEWSCNQGYDLGYHRDICVSDLEPYCYKSTECPNIYGMSTSATSTTTQSTTDSPSAISTTDVNYPISPINDSTTSSSKRSNSIITDVSSLNHSDEPFTTDSKPVELSDPETTTSVNNTIKNSVTSVSSSMTVSEDPLHSTIISSTSQSPQESTDIYTGETIIMESDTSYLTTTALNDTNSITEGVSSEEISSTGKLSSTTKDTLTYTAEPSGNLTSNRAGTSASTSDSITLSPGGKETTLHSITNTLRTETVTRGTNQHITTYQITPESVTNGLTQAETTKFQEVETVTSKSPMLTNTQPMTRETPEITDQFSTMLQSTAGSLTEKQKTEQPSTTDRQQTTSQIFTDRNTEKTTYQQVTADDYTISSIDKQETTKQWTSSDITSVEQTVTTDIIDKSTAGIQGTTENTSSEKVTTVLSTEQTTKSGLKTEEMTTALDTNKITDLSTKSTGLTFTNTDDSTTLDNSNQITDSTNLSTNSQVTVEDIRTSGQLFTTTSGNELTSGNNMEHAQTFRTTKSTTINVMTEEEASSVSQARTSAFNDRTTIQSTQQIVTDEITVSTIIHGQTEVMSTERTTVSTNEITTLKESKQKLTSQQEETTVSASTYQPKQTMSTENIAVSTDEKTTVEQSQPLSSESTITSSDEKTTVHSTQPMATESTITSSGKKTTVHSTHPMTTESTSTSGISTIQPTTQTIQSTTLTVQPTTPAVQPMTPTIQPTTLTTLPPYILPGYVIGIYSELITAINIDQACLDQINILISDVLSSKDGVSNALKTTKSCSKYAINVTMETSVRKPSDVNSIEITKNFSLGGQSQAVLTPCGQVIDELLRKDLAGSLDKILSQTMCLQSVDSTEIRFSQWQCPDGYNMDGSGEICNLITPTTQATVETTTTKPTTTTTKTTTQTTTPGVTLPPTSAAFYLIEVKAIYEGSNLTDGPCVNATRRQIEEKVEIISNGIKTQLNTKKECSKLSDIVLLTRTGKIAVTPERLRLIIEYPIDHRLELTAPFAIQSPSGDIEIVTSCAENAVKTYIENKAQNILNELSPGVCFITIKSFNIPFYGWACNEHYEYDDASQICRLEQTTPATTQSLSLSNGANIQFSVPFATFTMKLQFYKAYAKDPDFCKSEYQKTLISLLWNQTLVLNDKKNSDVQSHCEDVYTSLYGIDSKPDDVVLSLRSTTLDVLIKVKMFAVSSRVVMNSYNVCIGHYSGMFMDISNNVIIGRSNLSSTNGSLCSVPQLKSSNFISNFTYNCSTGYEETSQFLCLKEDRVKYFVPLKLLYSWSAPSSDTCLQALMSALENTSKDYILHYTSSPKCQSNVIIQLNGSISSSYLQTYEAFNITLGYVLSSLDVNLIGGLQRCGDIVTSDIKQFFNNKMNQIRADTIGQCGSGNPSVSMPVFKGYYLCPDNKTWDQGVLQCVSLDGRRRRSAWSFKPVLDRSKQIFPGVHSTNQRQKRSTEETPNAFWNSSVPTCKDIEPPVFRNCPQKNVILYKEFWGPVMAVVNLPSVVDNSGISPRVTVTPTDFRQPYMFRQNTTISMLAEDLSGNKAFCNINVTVIDVYPLVIQCPVDVVRVSYPTINDSVQTNYSGVKASEAAVKITYNPPNGSLVQIKDLVNVMAIAHDRFGNTTSCQFTYEATRNEQLPQYRIKVNYNTPTLEFSDNCSRQYGRKIIEKIHALEQLIPDCNNSFNLMPDTVQDTPEKLTIETSVIFANFGTLDFGKMEKCGRTAITKIKELGNLTITVATCPEYILTLLNDEPTPKFLCEGHYMVLNQTSKFCSYCRKGTYVNSMAGRCEVCPLAPDSTQSECHLCTGDNTNCIGTCKPGEYSPTGLQPCTKCSNNSYSDSYKSTICKSCPTGQFTLSTGTNSQNGCLDVCPIGEYSSSGLVPCKPCPVMFYSNKTQSQHCIECPRGLVTTSNGSTSLSQCVDPAICSGNVCNGGTCIPVDNGRYFTCQCPPGITGTICELDVQECSSNPCIHGDCIDENNSYTCVCQTGYTGHNCETNIDNCFPGACINSTCVDGDDTYSCLCYDGYTGNSTCTEINECDPDPCRHGGICIDLINDFICNCSGTGYVGKTCDLLTERCYNGSCLNDGVCHPHDNGYSCSCAQGFTGRYCEVNINDCEGHYCKNGAVCIDGVDQYSCLCQAGYTGDQCNINMMCDTSPCFNAASCTTTTTGFQCHCPPGYTGVLCEVNIDECKNNMCNPEKSQCKDDINSYTCDCLPGWTGKYCTQPINDCLSIPCAHGSTCIDLDDQYLCNCNEGFTGHNCSINIDECESNPCFNGGQCIDEVSGYTCICRGSFKGKQCQIQIDLCADTPCLHNGTCQNLVDSYLCWCELGWTGVRCETMVNNCISLPCANNGTCFNGINQYSCNCLQGYTGSHCQEDINECLNHPCLNGGQCVNLIGGYQCLCLDGFHGHDCNDLDQICPVCQNGATECYNGNCVCLPGFVGPDCGKERNPGYDLYFHDNTSLETNVTRMKNRNNLSVCLWVKVLSLSEGQPVFSLNAVLRGNKEQEILSLTTKRLHLGYYGDTWVNLTTTPGVWTYLCFTWDSNNNGHWKVYIDGQLQIEGVGYGNGQELPPLQKVALGKPTVENSTTFHGLISQLNVYDHILNSTTISNSSDNCSVSVSPGTVFRWQQFSAYVRPGIGVEEPSVCGSEVCPGDYNGQFCDDSVDTKSPTIEYCPEYVQVVTSNRLNIINWTEPRFTDDVEIVNVVQTHRPGEVFAYGEYDVMYIAYDSENNTAVCSFTVYVIPSNCSKPKAPPNVSLTCADWSKGISCSVRCNQPSIHNFVEQIPSFYKCGREGFWDPPRGKDFTFPICAESSEPSSTIQGEMVFLGPICSTEYKQLLGENFNKNMNQWNMEFGLCPTTGCNFSNVTIACNMARRRKRSTDSTYYVTFDIPVNGSLMTDSADALPLTQLETMIKNKEFNTADFSCDPEKLVVKPYIKCQLGQILVNGLCVNCAKGTYFNSVTGTCEVCQRGQYTDQEKQVACLSCDSGFTTENTGSTSSSSCYKVCPAGDYYDSKMSGCKSCPRGYYQDLTGTTSCKSCGNGQTTQETGSVSVSDCQSTCKAGTELSIYGICEPCALGTYKPTDGENSCLPCPYGKSTETVGAISQEQCSVISCPQDFYYDLESNGCKVCPPGYHQPYQGQRSCIPCTKFDFHVIKCSSGEVDECILGQDNCNENADCVDTKDSFQCNCKWGYTGNGTYCQDKCSGACGHGSACIIDNNGEPVCKTITSDTFPIIAVAGGASSFVLIFMLIGTVIICRRRSQQKKRKHGSHNYQHIDRVHRHIEVVTYPRGVARTVQFRTNPAYSDSELSDPTYFGEPTALWTRTMYPDHEDLTQYSETSMTRPLRLRIPTAVRIQHNYETESNKSWHESTAGSDLSQFQDDSDPHHSSPNSSISKYRVDSNPKDSSPSSSISQYKEDSLHKNDSPISNKSDLSDSYF